MIANKKLTIKQRYNMLRKPEETSFELEGKKQKYPRDIFKAPKEKSAASIIRYAVKNERAAQAIERDNTLTFVVDTNASKPEIKKAIVELYNTPVQKINTVISFKLGVKKAYVRFEKEGEAVEIATRAGVL
ncbi:large subunit ribosomal protein L23Ae [Enteropsectra breve]|nr:large subunit ribosomal protein L23Ae [Enteropsectra breve]